MLQLSMNHLEDGKEFHFPSWWKNLFCLIHFHRIPFIQQLLGSGPDIVSLNPHSTTLRLVFYYCFTAKERASHQEHTGPACPILAHAIFKWAHSKSPTRGLSVLVVSDFLNLQLSLPHCQSSLLLSPTFYANEFWEERSWDCHQMPLDTSYLGSFWKPEKKKKKSWVIKAFFRQSILHWVSVLVFLKICYFI